MGVQEISVLVIVVVAAAFATKRFIGQFTHGDEASGKCASCELSKTIAGQKKN